jgi:hypothetical protein
MSQKAMKDSRQTRQPDATTVDVREFVREMLARKARLVREAHIITIKKQTTRASIPRSATTPIRREATLYNQR